MIINGSALDTRLRNSLLLDVKLQRRLTGEEFRSFINLMVFTVAQVSDGVFDPDDAELVVTDRAHFETLAKVGVLEREGDTYRLHPDYWQWQSSKAELEKLAAKRQADKLRKQKERKAANPENFDEQEPW